MTSYIVENNSEVRDTIYLGRAAINAQLAVSGSQVAPTTLTLPISTCNLLGDTTTNILTNKTITDSSNSVAGSSFNTGAQNTVISSSVLPTAGASLLATSAASAQWTVLGQANFGNGSNGVGTISVNTSMASDMYYTNLTVNSGITYKTNGYRLF